MKKLTLLLMMLFVLGSFQDDKQMVNIDSDIKVKATIVESKVVLSSLSKTIYPCLNYHITFEKEVIKDKIKIRFKKITIPEICAAALGPASCTIDLGGLKSGEYELSFFVNEIETKGVLNVGSTTNLKLEPGGSVIPM